MHSLLPQLQQGLVCALRLTHWTSTVPTSASIYAGSVACAGWVDPHSSHCVITQLPHNHQVQWLLAAPGSQCSVGNDFCLIHSLLTISFPRHVTLFAVRGGQALWGYSLTGLAGLQLWKIFVGPSISGNYRRIYRI